MNLKLSVDDKTRTSKQITVQLTVFDDPQTRNAAKRGGSGMRETFLNVSVDPTIRASSPRSLNRARSCCAWTAA